MSNWHGRQKDKEQGLTDDGNWSSVNWASPEGTGWFIPKKEYLQLRH